jgi:pimeloyl-ACP methyl ester carboxylesterase
MRIGDWSTMTVVFINGNPETSAIWEPVAAGLSSTEVVLLEPPAFGGDMPPEFTATFDAYELWLADELVRFSDPVDIVGHDWGGILALAIAMDQPRLIRSWVSDAIGVFDPTYVWHDLARTWQTAGEGEAAVQQLLDLTPGERTQILTGLGITPNVAGTLALAYNRQTANATLSLYRSSNQPVMAQHGIALHRAALRRGLVVVAGNDHTVGSAASRRRMAEIAGARTVDFPDSGHWWMLDSPISAVTVLKEFWAHEESGSASEAKIAERVA